MGCSRRAGFGGCSLRLASEWNGDARLGLGRTLHWLGKATQVRPLGRYLEGCGGGGIRTLAVVRVGGSYWGVRIVVTGFRAMEGCAAPWQPRNRAIDHKGKSILSLADGLHAHWNRLDPDYHRKYLTVIRHDVQRLQYLTAGLPVPPTPALDKRWTAEPSCIEGFESYIREMDLRGSRVAEQLTRFAGLICRGQLDSGAGGDRRKLYRESWRG